VTVPAVPQRLPHEAPSRGAVAAVDCGTNSTRLLVLDGDDSQLDRLMRITRLGKGVDATGVLDPAAIARTLDVLDEYRAVIDRRRVEAVRMAATSAVRDAANGGDFLAAAGRVVGVPAELLTGEEEGRLAYAGATSRLPPGDEVPLVVDIGGGSTELIVGSGSAPGGEPRIDAVSVDLGCVRLTERFFHHDPPLATEQAACEACIAAELERAVRAVPGLEGTGRRLVGLAGTVSTLSMLDQGLRDYAWERVHHSVLDLAAVERWCDTLAAEPAASRALRSGMVEGREDVIVAGAFVLRDVMRRFGFQRCLVSETDILDGLAAGLLRPTPSAG
jgi:exopolyphosphatase/guanosine-5'-triphosphate,3'-diphosphate pyrophosphatase